MSLHERLKDAGRELVAVVVTASACIAIAVLHVVFAWPELGGPGSGVSKEVEDIFFITLVGECVAVIFVYGHSIGRTLARWTGDWYSEKLLTEGDASKVGPAKIAAVVFIVVRRLALDRAMGRPLFETVTVIALAVVPLVALLVKRFPCFRERQSKTQRNAHLP